MQQIHVRLFELIAFVFAGNKSTENCKQARFDSQSLAPPYRSTGERQLRTTRKRDKYGNTHSISIHLNEFENLKRQMSIQITIKTWFSFYHFVCASDWLVCENCCHSIYLCVTSALLWFLISYDVKTWYSQRIEWNTEFNCYMMPPISCVCIFYNVGYDWAAWRCMRRSFENYFAWWCRMEVDIHGEKWRLKHR